MFVLEIFKKFRKVQKKPRYDHLEFCHLEIIIGKIVVYILPVLFFLSNCIIVLLVKLISYNTCYLVIPLKF